MALALYLTNGPALALVELCSIARGVQACDAMIKKATVQLLRAGTTHPGKYIIIVRGGVDEVKESMEAGLTASGDALVDQLLLPNPHPQLMEVLDGPREVPLDAVAVLETYSMASVIRGADAALKAADVSARRLRLANDLGGKGCFVFCGALQDIEAAMSAAVDVVGHGLLAGQEIIANPHPDLIDALD